MLDVSKQMQRTSYAYAPVTEEANLLQETTQFRHPRILAKAAASTIDRQHSSRKRHGFSSHLTQLSFKQRWQGFVCCNPNDRRIESIRRDGRVEVVLVVVVVCILPLSETINAL